jgi:cell fate regulator YaaT (PSP1 superfamily)
MPDVVGVRFKPCGKIYDFEVDGLECRKGDLVVVESELGINLGNVVIERHTVDNADKALKKIIRKAGESDLLQKEENRALESESKEYCLERIMARGLPMKLVCTESTLDKKLIIFFFTAEKRIDFRELVKDLASRFKTRIEMRQIGVRDSARIVGSLGICGRELCCTKFLTSFEPISIKMAKKQELVLNTSKLSGSCGRLMCCLGYEYSEIPQEEPVYAENEAIAITEDEEAGEVVVASSDALAESTESSPQRASEAAVSSQKTPESPQQQQEKRGRREKRRKWYPRKRKKRPQTP